jgi:hypothetical protein
MAEPMTSLVARRTLGIGMTIMVSATLVILAHLAQGNIGYTSHFSGWTLLALIVFLALYNVRKTVPFLPLGSSSAWLQLHIYVGLLTGTLFAVHVDFSVPDGIFECLLTLIYLSVLLSGLIGLYMTRSFPARLTMLGNEVIFEQIPVVRRELQDRVEALVVIENSDHEKTAIAHFYRHQIRPFLLTHHDLATQLTRGTSARWHQLSRAIEDQNRYLDQEERRLMDEVREHVRRKFQLDTQYALQGALKVWLFFHIPAVWALLIFAFFHSILVHAWSGGLP